MSEPSLHAGAPTPEAGPGAPAADAWPLATGRLPILYWLRRYQRGWLSRDLAAAAAVTALIVPKNLGYAEIAGIPVQNGLYAAAAGAIIYALFCTSRHISTGPSSGLAAVAGGAVAVAGVSGDQAAELVAAIALGTGLLFLAAGGPAAGLDRALPVPPGRRRLPRRRRSPGGDRRAAEADGHARRGRQLVARAAVVARGRSAVHWTTVAVGAVALAVILGLRFRAPAVPGALVLVAGGLLGRGRSTSVRAV